jgi:hypothetical protein
VTTDGDGGRPRGVGIAQLSTEERVFGTMLSDWLARSSSSGRALAGDVDRAPVGRCRATLGQHEARKTSCLANDVRPRNRLLTCIFTDLQRRPMTPRTHSQGGSAGSNPVGGTAVARGPGQRRRWPGPLLSSRLQGARATARQHGGAARVRRAIPADRLQDLQQRRGEQQRPTKKATTVVCGPTRLCDAGMGPATQQTAPATHRTAIHHHARRGAHRTLTA